MVLLGMSECVPVPLENFFRSLEPSEERIAFRLVRRANVIPADFFVLVWVDIGAQCFRD